MWLGTWYLGHIQRFAAKLKILLGSSFEISMILLEATFYSLAQANIPDCAQIFIRDSGSRLTCKMNVSIFWTEREVRWETY